MLIETVVEEAEVVSVEGGECVVRIRPVDTEACKGCGMCLGDPAQALAKNVLRAAGRGTESVGDAVRVEVRKPNPAAAAGAVFIVPLVCMAALAAAGGYLSVAAGIDQVIGGSIGAVLGLAPAILIARMFQSMWKARGAFTARIIGNAPKREAAPGCAASSDAAASERDSRSS